MEIAEALGMVLGVGLYGLFVAAFAIGIAFWLGTAEHPLPIRKRATVSASVGSGILSLVPIAAIAVMGEWTTEIFVVLVVMLVGAAFLAATFGFPAAYFFAKRAEARASAEMREGQ